MSAIRDYAEQHQCGLIEARAAVKRLNKIERLEALRARCRWSNVADDILIDLIDELIKDAKA